MNLKAPNISQNNLTIETPGTRPQLRSQPRQSEFIPLPPACLRCSRLVANTNSSFYKAFA